MSHSLSPDLIRTNTNTYVKPQFSNVLKIIIENRDYSLWNIIPYNTEENGSSISQDLLGFHCYPNPINEKLFSKDIFSFDNPNNKITVIESPIRNKKEIPGILVLENNKTFGRTQNKKRLYYKCIPNDRQLPIFLVPYEIQLGFSKIQQNKFVTFRFDSWEDKHPHGVLVQTIGTVDNLECFYEYQLYCRDLHVSITPFIKKTREKIEKMGEQELTNRIIEHYGYGSTDFMNDRRKTHNVFSMDPEGCVDIDDAISIHPTENGYEISVYIANVVFWLETFQLWEHFTERISTIYLPDKRRPMLPILLSENLCSLQKEKERFAFTMVVHIDNEGNIQNTKIINTFIVVKENYAYEEPKLLKNKDYQLLLDITQKMDSTTKDSHDVVAFWMILMNTYCGELMRKNKRGIFRSSRFLRVPVQNMNTQAYTNETARFLNMWNNVSGEYSLYKEGEQLKHTCLNKETYVHITSPIRRIVDTINQFILIKDLNLIQKISNEGEHFIEKWFSQIEKLNNIMKSIRKVQSDCELVNKCFMNPEIMNREYKGIIIERTSLNNDLRGFSQYTVYLEDLKIVSRISCKLDLQELSIYMFRIYLFEDEEKIQKKIRLQIISSQCSSKIIE